MNDPKKEKILKLAAPDLFLCQIQFQQILTVSQQN